MVAKPSVEYQPYYNYVNGGNGGIVVPEGNLPPSTLTIVHNTFGRVRADVYRGALYDERIEDLAAITKSLADRTGLWTPEVVAEMVDGGVAKVNLGRQKGWIEDVSMIFLMPPDAPKGKLDEAFGMSWQHVDKFDIGGDIHRAEYLRLRVLLPMYRGANLGGNLVEVGSTIHNTDGQVIQIIARTGSVTAAKSFRDAMIDRNNPNQGGLFKKGRRFPHDLLYHQDPDSRRIPQAIMQKTHERYRTLGTWIDPRTGVSPRDYMAINETWSFDREDPRNEELIRLELYMRNKLGMRFERRDSVIQVAELA